ncbi:MAG: cysteine synthase family protein [Acidobacteriota bacterium]
MRYLNATILDGIGNTPLVSLNHLNPFPGVQMFAKIEGMNPTGSLKDRIAKYMIERAEEEGSLTREKIIIEASSGNTGISLGMVAAIKGYKVKIFMPETKSIERRKTMLLGGVEIVLTSGKDQNSHIKATEELARTESEKYFYFDQNGNENNVNAHYHTTAAEIISQMNGKIDVLVAGFGTGGTIIGCARRIKQVNRNALIISVEPEKPISKIEGLLHMNGEYIPKIYNPSLIDHVERVSDQNAVEMTRRIAREEGIYAGISSGAVLFAALKWAERLKKGNFILIFADRADRYLSTVLCEGLA